MVDILQVLTKLADSYGMGLTDSQITIYTDTLSDIPVDALERAATEHIKTSKWFPKVAELRAIAIKDRSWQYEQERQDEIRIYWQAMENFNASLRGELTKDELYREPAWKYYERHREPPIIDPEAEEIYQQECEALELAEVA
jgi:hypothetical protein